MRKEKEIQKMVGVIDYDAGNVKSVMKAVEKLGGEAVLTADPAVLDQCSSLILPGVGSFGKAAEKPEKDGSGPVSFKGRSGRQTAAGYLSRKQMLFRQEF